MVPIGKVKRDYAYKILLRAFRRALKRLFKNCHDLSKGRYKWREEVWFKRVPIFLKRSFNLSSVSMRDIAAVILMLYPAKGDSTSKVPIKRADEKSEVYKHLQEDGFKLFKMTITGSNTQSSRQMFFSSPIIVALWPHVLPHMTKKVVFKNIEPYELYFPTFRAMI